MIRRIETAIPRKARLRMCVKARMFKEVLFRLRLPVKFAHQLVRMRSTICFSALIGAMLCSSAVEAIPQNSREKYRFLTTVNYQKRPLEPYEKVCHSVDFSENPMEDGDQFMYCEGKIGGPSGQDLKCDYAELMDVRTESNSAFCVTFMWSGDGEDKKKHIWKNNEKMAMASDCEGEPPLAMYMSSVADGMCGQISKPYQDLFRYKDDDQKCASVNLGAYGQNEKGQPQEGMLVGDACTGSYETCMAPGNVTIEKIHSYLENDAGNWTCVALASPMGSQHLWLLDESDDTDMNMALLKSTGSCSSDDAPAMEDAYEIEEGMMCPKLHTEDERHFYDGQDCRSFDFSKGKTMFSDEEFRWCWQNNTVLADCHPAIITDMNITANNKWFCLTLTIQDGDSTTQHLWVTNDGMKAQVTDECGVEPPPSNAMETESGRCSCENTKSGAKCLGGSTIQFQDFDGVCHSLDIRNNQTGGGNENYMYSEFQYCHNGVYNWDMASQHVRSCDRDAIIEYIHVVNGYTCMKFSSDIQEFGKDHIWFDPSSSMVAMSSDCQDMKPLSSNPNRWTHYNVGKSNDEPVFCEVLPDALTGGPMRFWSHYDKFEGTYCHSFHFNPMIVTESERTPDGQPGSDNDLFEYCSGSGGKRVCTTNTQRYNMQKMEPWASIQKFARVENSMGYVWYCVKYNYEWMGLGQMNVGLWLNADNMTAVLADDCDKSSVPENMESTHSLEAQECKVIPDNAQKQLMWKQGGHRVSVDLSMNPGRRAGTFNRFTFCTHNGHCFPAKPMKIHNPGDSSDVCIDFQFTNDYGLDDHRGVWVGKNMNAQLVSMCDTGQGDANKDATNGMTQRFPGELQEQMSFWQYGRCVSFDLSPPPTEERGTLKMCQDVRGNSWCDDEAELVSVVNPANTPTPNRNPLSQQNWYCATISYTDEYGISDKVYVWMNPHYYGWDKGYATVVDHDKKCDWNQFRLIAPTDDENPPQNGNYVLRGGKLCNDFF